MRISPDLEQQILALPGVVVRGGRSMLPIPERPEPTPRQARRLLCDAAFRPPATWLVPVYVYCGDNSRGLGKRIGRGGHERWAVHRTLASQYAALTQFVEQIQDGGPVVVTLTRLGPRQMDRSNVIAALKFVQDAVAERFGIDDGDQRFRWEYGQELSDRYGVRVEVQS